VVLFSSLPRIVAVGKSTPSPGHILSRR